MRTRKSMIWAVAIGLCLSATAAVAGNYLYWPDGSTAWNGSYGYHDDGSTAWNGSYGYHDDGSTAWNGSYGYHDDGSTAWNGSYCYHDNGSTAGTGSCAWSWGPGVSFSIIKSGGVASCTLFIASGAVAVPCH